MKLIILLVAIFAVTALGVPLGENAAEIVLYETDGDDNGYNFQFETSDGVARVEKGELKDTGDPEGKSLNVEGVYTWSDDKGVSHTVRYKADENGYRVLPN